MSPGTGRPPSMYRLPPLGRTRKKLWLLPKVWLQGSQSTTTGGVVARKGQQAKRLSWLAVSIRWVLTTPFGRPVDPEVKSTLAIVSGLTAAKAAFTAARACSDGPSLRLASATTSAVDQTGTVTPVSPVTPVAPAIASSAGAKRAGSSTKIRLGRSWRATSPSRSKVVEASAYELEMGAAGTPTCIAASIISAVATLLSGRIITGRSAVAPASSSAAASASTRASAALYVTVLQPPSPRAPPGTPCPVAPRPSAPATRRRRARGPTRRRAGSRRGAARRRAHAPSLRGEQLDHAWTLAQLRRRINRLRLGNDGGGRGDCLNLNLHLGHQLGHRAMVRARSSASRWSSVRFPSKDSVARSR